MAEETDSQTPTDSPARLPASAGSDVELSRVWKHMAETHSIHLTASEEHDIKSAVLDDYDAERIKQGARIMRLEGDAAGDRARCDLAEKEADALREALIGLVLVTQKLGELGDSGAEDWEDVDHILSMGDCRRIAEAVGKAKVTLEDSAP